MRNSFFYYITSVAIHIFFLWMAGNALLVVDNQSTLSLIALTGHQEKTVTQIYKSFSTNDRLPLFPLRRSIAIPQIASPSPIVELPVIDYSEEFLQEIPIKEHPPLPPRKKLSTEKISSIFSASVENSSTAKTHLPKQIIVIPPVVLEITPPKLLLGKPPVFPQQARRSHQSGRVILNIQVLIDGSVGEIQIEQSSGYTLLDKAAIKAVKTWQFTPAYRGKMAFTTWTQLPIYFQLK